MNKAPKDENVAYADPTEMDKELPYQLIGVGYDFHQHPTDRPFGYPTYQWIQTRQGCGVLRLDGKDEYHIGMNQGMLLYPGDAHEYWEVEAPWQVHWISFNGYHIERMLHKLGFDRTGIFSLSNTSITENLMQRAFQVLSHDAPLSGMDGSVIIYQLLFDLHRGIKISEGPSHGERTTRLQPVFDHIKNNIEYVITVEELADLIGITSQHFCVLFKDVTGYRPIDYINSRRIKMAKELLVKEPSLQVSQIGKRVGFDNNSYFSTIFRKYEGISPRKYKELH
ncbi:MAG: AraC family transcriptional regulator [Spirochaetales bacterium]|nr:AraC family transcriptional regulator [Spirochaetales bacterium]